LATVRDLVARSNAGEPDAVDRLRRAFDDRPEVRAQLGDLSRLCERTWVGLIRGGGGLCEQAVRLQLAELKAGLLGENPTPLERMLVDHAAVSYLADCDAQLRAASPPSSPQVDAARLKRAESTQRRLLNSLKTLAVLRALVPRGLLPRTGVRLFDPETRAG